MGTGTTAIVTAVLFVAMAAQSAPLSPSIPEIQFTYSPEAFNAILTQWQQDGVQRFKGHFAIDFPFLLAYGLLGYRLVREQAGHWDIAPGVRRGLLWNLPLAAFLDALENVHHLYFVYARHEIPAWLYGAAGTISTVKWLLIAAFPVGMLLAWLRTRR